MSQTGLRYRRADYVPVSSWWRWWPLARQEFTLLFRNKLSIALFCLCLLPFVVRWFVLMIRFGVVSFGVGPRRDSMMRSQGMATWDPERVDFYLEMVMGTWPGLPVLILLTAATTAGAVARDRRTNALELLWTRGISPLAYFGAKLLGSILGLGLVTVAAPLLLWCMAILMADDWQFLLQTWTFIPPLLGALLLTTTCWALLCVAISTICSTTSQAIVAWCLLVLGSSAVANVLAAVFRLPWLRAALSVFDAGASLARHLAGSTIRVHAGTAGFFLAALLVVFLIAAVRRLRTTEALG